MQLVLGKGIYTQFALLLDYPQESITELIEGCVKVLNDSPQYPPEVTEEIDRFRERVEGMPLGDLQGIYSYTFEMSADLTLDMAYNQYEGFKRSNILVSIKGMYKDQEFPFDSVAKGELPDHLPVVLRFLDFLQDGELKRDFRESFLIKGLEKLKKNIESKPDNPYNHLINALWVIIDKDVKGVASVQHLKE